MKIQLRCILSLVLAAAMLLSTVGCVFQEKTPDSMQSQTTASTEPQTAVPTEPQQEDLTAVELSQQDKVITDELTREEKEEIVQVLGNGSEEVSDLDDEALDEIVDELIQELEKEEQAPSIEMEVDEDAYDEDGAMNQPFDQVYPELIEKEEVKLRHS